MHKARPRERDGIVAFDLAAAEASRMNRTANATTKRIAERESRRCRQSVISAALLRGSFVFTQSTKAGYTRGAVDTPRNEERACGASPNTSASESRWNSRDRCCDLPLAGQRCAELRANIPPYVPISFAKFPSVRFS